MPTLPRRHRGGSRRVGAKIKRAGERPTAHRRGYDARWRRARRLQLARFPLCAACARQGQTKLANTVDHIRPHRGDRQLFWDPQNWQSLCRRCHNQKTAKGE